MHLLPLDATTPLTDHELEKIYAYPESLTRPWVQVNFVASADGAASLNGKAASLSHPADKKILALGRDLADVVLVGAGTVLVEGYRGIRHTALRASRRARLGLSELPPIAVVSGRCSIGPESSVVADTSVPPIVITTETAPAGRRADLVAAGADVVVAGADRVDPARALDALAERGLLRVCCEGGPTLFADLVAAGLVDQLCLTVAPLLTGAGASRIVEGVRAAAPVGLELASALTEDGFLMLRYRRR